MNNEISERHGGVMSGINYYMFVLQKMFVIFVFSEHHVEQVVSLIKYVLLLICIFKFIKQMC